MTTIDVEGTELPTPQKPRYVPLLAVTLSRGRIVETVATPTRTTSRLDCLEAKPKRLPTSPTVLALEGKHP